MTTDTILDAPPLVTSLASLLATRAEAEPDRTLLTALDREGAVAEAATTSDLDRDARRLAVALLEVCAPGDRVLVPAMPGLDFHRAFMACLYAELVAVPVPPIRTGGPRSRDARGARRLGRLVAICEDARPAAAVVPAADVTAVADLLAEAADTAALHVLPAVPPGPLFAPDPVALPGLGDVDPEATAFLQYTSGSTSAPRGVMVSHRAMVANQRVVAERYAIGPETTTVSWLPLYHDMGLCAGLLQPLYAGGEGLVMEPETFLVRPQRWLEALSHRPDVVSAAPDFAYLLTAARVSPAVKETLDLSGWRMALCGAEPVRAATVQFFTDAFAGCGLPATALTPAYGLAESTLFVSGNDVEQPAFVQRYDRESLGAGLGRRTDDPRGLELVGAGREGAGIDVAVVDPATLTLCPDGRVGELWVRSESNGSGYWGRPEESDAVFGAVCLDAPGRWLRTGDLGFRDTGELVVTGRLKDVVIIRGVNYYPQDFEGLVQGSSFALCTGLAAAFADPGDPERVTVVVEADPRTPDLATAAAEAGRAVTSELPVQVEVVVVERGRVPRTTSGKVRRKECSLRLAELDVLARWPRHG